ncbi:MAG: hypothetical protein V9E90_00505 [Saprospiraceae bacterium]
MAKLHPTIILIGIVLSFSCAHHSSKDQNHEIEVNEEAFEYFQFRSLVEDFPYSHTNDGTFYRTYQLFKKSNSHNTFRNLSQWNSIGPSNIAGRSLCIAINPLDTNELWMGSAGSGLWRSSTGGIGNTAWTYVPTNFPMSSVSSIAIQSNQPSTIYIGTGEVYNYNGTDGGLQTRTLRGSKGIGILKSQDHGLTWNLVLDWSLNNNTAVWKILINPTNPNVVFAATTQGVYRSVDGGLNWKINLDIPMALDLLMDGEDPKIIYAAIGGINSPEYGIYKTSNSGLNWKKIQSPNDSFYEGRIMLASYKKNPKKVYAAFSDAFKSVGMLRTTDRFDSIKYYTPIKDVTSYQGWYAKCLHIKDDDSSQLIMGGVDLYIDTTGTGNQLFNLILRRIKIHADMHDIISNPFDANKIYIATDGGLYRSNNFANSFFPCNGGYLSSQFYTGSLAKNGIHLLAGLQDNRSAIYSGVNQWRVTNLGDGTYNAFDPVQDSLIYCSSQYQNLYKSTDFGNQWEELIPPNQEAGFVSPFILCKSDPNRIYSGGNVLLMSANRGTSWDTTFFSNKNEKITAIADNPNRSKEVFVATVIEPSKITKLYYSQDAGKHLLLIDNSIPERMIRDIIIDPNEENRLYICLGSYGRPGIMVSTNYGLDWNFLDNNYLPDVPIHCLSIDPNDSNILYAGTDLGLFFSTDQGSNWKSYNMHPYDLVAVYDLLFNNLKRELVIFTHSHGAFTVDAIDKNTVKVSHQKKKTIQCLVINRKLYLVGVESIPTNLMILSSSGQNFFLNNSNNAFDVELLPPGIYYLISHDFGVLKFILI